uniref:Uncharacterized protein n=1 Tax=Sinocyclocheilus grahami TaxID=75366 RepID=A0A672K4S7_SINGR
GCISECVFISCLGLEQKKAYDKARSRTRVHIGSAFQHWRELKEREGLRSDAEVALFLLDRRVTLVLLCFTELIYAGFCLNMFVCHNRCLGCGRMCGAELSK